MAFENEQFFVFPCGKMLPELLETSEVLLCSYSQHRRTASRKPSSRLASLVFVHDTRKSATRKSTGSRLSPQIGMFMPQNRPIRPSYGLTLCQVDFRSWQCDSEDFPEWTWTRYWALPPCSLRRPRN